MRSVTIKELESGLASHLQSVKNGQEIVVCHRDEAVARLVPCRTVGIEPVAAQALSVDGRITPPRKKRRPMSEWPEIPGNIPSDVMARVWREDREDR